MIQDFRLVVPPGSVVAGNGARIDPRRTEQTLALCDRTACQAPWVGYLLETMGVLLARTLRSLPMQEEEWQRQWLQA